MSAGVSDPLLEEWTFDPDPRSAFAPIVSVYDVEHALARCVRRWQRDYLAEVARQRRLAPETFPPYRSLHVSEELEKFPEEQLPALVVRSPGTQTGEAGTHRYGDGHYDGRLVVECATVIAAGGNRQAGKLARLYTAGVRALALQQALEPEAALTLRRVDWTGERYDRIRPDGDRTIAIGVALLAVDVVAMSYWQRGPKEPGLPPTPPEEEPPPREWPRVARTQITISKEGG